MNSKSNSGKLTLENLQDRLAEWKQPHLQKVKQAAQDFHEKVRMLQKTGVKRGSIDEPMSSQTVRESSDCDEEQKYEVKAGLHQSGVSSREQALTQQVVRFRQWQPNTKWGFKDHEEILKNYHNVFQRKIKLRRNREIGDAGDFRSDERRMFAEIHQELRSPKKSTVLFESIIDFFDKCELFYYFYNIPPNRLPNLLREAAKTHEGRLTKQEFFDFFLIERPTLLQYQCKTEKHIEGSCVLSDEAWKNLRAIFETLDTFGNGKIRIKNFFKRIRNNPSNLSLLNSQAISFPEINRCYKLDKVLFELEHKTSFSEKVEWMEIQSLIQNFTHIQKPSLDEIFESQISKGMITKQSNYFMLDKKPMKYLKQIFYQCPRYHNVFIKSSFFAAELLESQYLKPFLKDATRLENSTYKLYMNLETVIKLLPKEAPEYFDLDEMIEHFSIKGPTAARRAAYLEDNFSTSSSEDIGLERQQRKLMKIKSLQQLKRANKAKRKNRPKYFEPTKQVEFNLHEKHRPTIRDVKVQAMIEQKLMEDEIELRNKFKANPIPVALNPERYQQYAKKMQKRKQSIMNRLKANKEEGLVVLERLQANTKLFENRNSKPHCEWATQAKYSFEPKPLPPHVSERLLPKIQREKQERRRLLFETTKKAYEQKYWKSISWFEKQESEEENDSLLDQIEDMEYLRSFEQIKANEVPNFKELHRKFARQLESRKQTIKPTVPKEFRFSSPQNTKKQPHCYQQVEPRHFRSKSPPVHTDTAPPIKTTKKNQDWVAYNQARRAEKQIEMLEKQRQEEQRLLKQKNFARYMRKNLRGRPGTSAGLLKKRQTKLKNFRKYIHDLQKHTEKQLGQIYSRVLQRPFLFETVDKQASRRSQEKPVRIHAHPLENSQELEFKPEMFRRDEQDFHPMESSNLNQSF